MNYDKISFLAGLSAGRVLKGASGGGGGGGSGGTVSGTLYVENGDITGIDFTKYKAGDAILIVEDFVIDGSGVTGTLYVENGTPDGIDFTKYQAGDAILAVEDVVVST